jgi:3-hydroxyacyl-[acyl-carrier-protein] dehydratase
MRFLLFDRVVEAERARSLTGVKHVSLMDGALAQHYPRRAVLPGTLVVEAMAQLCGMLHAYTHDFTVEMLLVLVDRVTLARPVLHGETLLVEARSGYDHPYGATMSGTASVDGEPVAAAERIVFAHDTISDPRRIQAARDRFEYQCGLRAAAVAP